MRSVPWKAASFRARDSSPRAGPIQSENSVNLSMGSAAMTEVARQGGGSQQEGAGAQGKSLNKGHGAI